LVGRAPNPLVFVHGLVHLSTGLLTHRAPGIPVFLADAGRCFGARANAPELRLEAPFRRTAENFYTGICTAVDDLKGIRSSKKFG